MPVKPVRRKGRVVGYRWGRSGKLYRGKGVKSKASCQGRAARANGCRG